MSDSKLKNLKSKTAADYVAPHNYLPTTVALDTAKQDYFHERIFNVAQVAYKHGATQSEVAEALGVYVTFVSRKYPKNAKEDIKKPSDN